MNEVFKLDTEEYGLVKGKLVSLQDVNALAKQRNDYVKFLGIYEQEGETYMAFFVQNRTLIAKTT